MICCVRSATITACSLGSASVSSIELVCSDCTPPSTPASAWIATRTTLFSGCCAVSEQPAVCACVRSSKRPRVLRAEALAHDRRPHAARGAELRDLLEEVVVDVEEERQARREVVDVEAALDRRLHVADAVGEREGELLRPPSSRLRGCGSRRSTPGASAARACAQNSIMSTMIRTDGSGGEIHSFCAMNSFSMSFWIVPPSFVERHALLFGDREVHREDRCWRSSSPSSTS